MTKYFEQEHAHAGIDRDGSKQVQYSSLANAPFDMRPVADLYTGFSGDPIVTDNGDNTITLSGSFEAYYHGELVRELVPGYVSPAIPATTTKVYFLTFDGSTVAWRDISVYPDFFKETLVAYCFYDATASKWVIFHETHGFMPWECHKADHNTIGTYKASGGTISAIVNSSTTAADRRPTIASTVIQDEDCATTLAQQTGSYTRARNTSTGTFTFTLAQDDIVYLSTNRPYYNSFSSPNWGDTLMTANSCATVWLFALPTALGNSASYRFVFVQPQWQTLATGSAAGQLLAARQVEELRSVSELNLTTLTSLSPEFICIARFTIQYTSSNWTVENVIYLSGTRYSLVGAPTGNFISTVTTDATLTGNGTTASPLGLNWDRGSELSPLTTTLGASTQTLYFTINAISGSVVGSAQTAICRIVTIADTNATSTLYLSTSITGTEAGSTSWSKIIDMTAIGGDGDILLILSPGRYAIYVTNPDLDETALYVTYKNITTNITY